LAPFPPSFPASFSPPFTTPSVSYSLSFLFYLLSLSFCVCLLSLSFCNNLRLLVCFLLVSIFPPRASFLLPFLTLYNLMSCVSSHFLYLLFFPYGIYVNLVLHSRGFNPFVVFPYRLISLAAGLIFLSPTRLVRIPDPDIHIHIYTLFGMPFRSFPHS